MKLRTKKILFNIFACLVLALSLISIFVSYDYMFNYFIELCKIIPQAFLFFGKNFVGIKEEQAPSNEAVDMVFRDFDFSLNIDYAGLEWKFKNFGSVFFDKHNFAMYNMFFLYYMLFAILYLFVVVLSWQIIRVLLSTLLHTPSSHPGEPTVALKWFKRWIVRPVVSFKNLVKRFFNTFWDYKRYKVPFVAIWLFNFNVINAVLEVLFWYFTFPYSPSLKGMGSFLLTLILDCLIALYNVPAIIWVILFGILLVKFRIKIAFGRLERQERRNIALVNKLSFDWLVHAKIRAGKTKLLAYVVTLKEKIFRKNAYKSIYKFKRKFPDFPWYKFFKDLDEAYEARKFKCPLTAELYVKGKKRLYNKRPVPENIYGYEGRQYFDDAYKYADLWDELAECAKCYFVYSVDTSLTVSSFPIRIDMKKDSIGNFNKWDDDMLHRKTEDFYNGRYSHNINWDSFRTKKHMNERSKFIGSFTFGSIIAQELDKERFNMITAEQFKGVDDRATPLNDGMSILLKTIGHASTYDNNTYYFNGADSQRTESLNADERALRDLVEITEVEKNKLTLPFYLEGIIIKIFNRFFEEFDLDLSYFAQDGASIPAYLLNHFISALFGYDFRVKNAYGYSLYRIRIHKEKSFEDFLLWVPDRIAHAYLYRTDSLKNFYVELAKQTIYGIQDIEEFDSLDMSWHKMLEQDSYAVEELRSAFGVDK